VGNEYPGIGAVFVAQPASIASATEPRITRELIGRRLSLMTWLSNLLLNGSHTARRATAAAGGQRSPRSDAQSKNADHAITGSSETFPSPGTSGAGGNPTISSLVSASRTTLHITAIPGSRLDSVKALITASIFTTPGEVFGSKLNFMDGLLSALTGAD